MAGPLFTAHEQKFNVELANDLKAAFRKPIDLWLPQVKCKGLIHPREIFANCVQGVETSDTILVNCDGGDMDSGTAWEAGLAFAMHKRIIAYRTDFRRAGDCDTNCNLMIGMSASVYIYAPGASPLTLGELLSQAL